MGVCALVSPGCKELTVQCGSLRSPSYEAVTLGSATERAQDTRGVCKGRFGQAGAGPSFCKSVLTEEMVEGVAGW